MLILHSFACIYFVVTKQKNILTFGERRPKFKFRVLHSIRVYILSDYLGNNTLCNFDLKGCRD